MSQQIKIKSGDNIIFYDGVCGLCNALVQFVLKHGGGLRFLFCSLQSDIAARLLAKYSASNTNLDTVFVLTNYDLPTSKLLEKAQAVFFILKHCELPWYSPWAWLVSLSFLPEFLLNFGYDFIASIRYKVFGQYESCLIPDKVVRDRFIDQ